jgi:hypothetical protein
MLAGDRCVIVEDYGKGMLPQEFTEPPSVISQTVRARSSRSIQIPAIRSSGVM